MKNLKETWREHIEVIEKSISLKALTGKDLNEWMEPLIQSVTDDGAIPYLLGTQERYRASPLASTISWLEKANLLPIPVLTKMQEKLIELRDENVQGDTHLSHKAKKPEDQDGWSAGEGVSVWSTSCAIEALLDTHENGCTKALAFKASVLWLANQRDVNKDAWAYQLSDNCEPNVVMTSLALRALALAYMESNRSKFAFSKQEEVILERAIKDGFNYLKENCVKNKYWCFNGKPHCAATTWALLALHWVSLCKAEISPDCKKFYEKCKHAALEFVCSKIPKKAIQWPDEPFVYEGGAKYGKQKNYVSFSATLLPQLFQLGVSPFHPRVINQIKWLIDHPADWKINTYDKGKICCFTYAMVISTITSWVQRIGSTLAPVLIRSSKRKYPKLLYGYNSSRSLEAQLVQTSRLTIFSALLALLVIALLFGKQIDQLATWLSTRLISLWVETENDRRDIAISVISEFLQGGIMAICAMVLAFVKKWRRFADD